MALSITLGVGLATSPVATTPSPPEHTVTLAELPRDALILDSGAARGVNGADLALSGTTDAPDGTRIMAEIVIADGTTVVVAARPVATASGGAWSGNVTGIPRNAAWLRPRVWAEGSVAKAITTGRFASGHVIAIWGQSEIQNITTASYNGVNGSVPVTTDDMVSVHYHTRVGNGAGFLVHRVINDGEVNTRFARIANSLTAAQPGEKFAVIFQTASGTGFKALVNDGPDNREWSDDLLLHETATGGGDVGMVAFDWYASTASYGNRYGTALHRVAFSKDIDGTPLSLPFTTFPAESIEFTANHTLAELYDWSVTKFTVVEPHRFEPAINEGMRSVRSSIRAMFVNSTEPALTAAPAHPVLHYANGNPQPDGTVTDGSHPRAGEGSERYGVGLVQSVIRAAGITNWQIPNVDNVYWEPAGAYVDIWSSAGPIRANALPPVGVFIDGKRADPAIVDTGGPAGNITGVMRVTAATFGSGAAFTSSTLLEFAPDSTGLIAANETADGWNRYPLVDVGAPGMPDGVPLGNDPDSVILKSTIKGVQTWNTLNDSAFIAEAHPNATQAYTIKIRAAVTSTSGFDGLMRDNDNKFIIQMNDPGSVQYGVGGAYGTSVINNAWTIGVMHDFVLSMNPTTGDFKFFVDGIQKISLTGTPWVWSTVRTVRLLGNTGASTALNATIENITLWREYSATGELAGPPHKLIEGDLAAAAAAANAAPAWKFYHLGVKQ